MALIPIYRSLVVLPLLALAACGDGDDDMMKNLEGGTGGKAPADAFRGTLTLSRNGAAELFSPVNVIDFDLATNGSVQRFAGFDAQRAPGGETAYITRLGGGLYADAAIVVANERGINEAPVYVCPMFSHVDNRVCHTPRLSPDGKYVAFGVASAGGKVCQDNYGLFFGSFVVVRDRRGVEVKRFEGWYDPEWLPDGRLVMMGTGCRNAGVWAADRALGEPTRIDGGQVATPAGPPVVSPDGKTLALIYANQLWTLSLDARHEMKQITASDKPVVSATWSPDGKAFAALLYDVSLPVRVIWLFTPDGKTQGVRPVDFYPYGPLTWR